MKSGGTGGTSARREAYPVTVSADSVLIAGLHRIEAFNRLGLREIPAIVFSYDEIQAKLAEVLENSARADLSELEKGEALLEAKNLYEALHPETKNPNERGGPGRGNKTADNLSAVLPFAEVAAKDAEESVSK